MTRKRGRQNWYPKVLVPTWYTHPPYAGMVPLSISLPFDPMSQIPLKSLTPSKHSAILFLSSSACNSPPAVRFGIRSVTLPLALQFPGALNRRADWQIGLPSLPIATIPPNERIKLNPPKPSLGRVWFIITVCSVPHFLWCGLSPRPSPSKNTWRTTRRRRDHVTRSPCPQPMRYAQELLRAWTKNKCQGPHWNSDLTRTA